MTTPFEIRAAGIGPTIKFSKASLQDVAALRCYLRWAIANVQYGSGSLIGFGEIVPDAEEHGFALSEEVRDEAVAAAARLEGFVLVALSGIKADGVIWPRYGGDPAIYEQYWRLVGEDKHDEAELLAHQIPLSQEAKDAMNERISRIARRMR